MSSSPHSKKTTAHGIATLVGAVSLCALVTLARAQNATNNHISGSTGTNSLLVTTNWSLGHLPTVSEDAVFTANPGIRPLSAGSLTVGSFNVTAHTGTFSIRNNTSTSTDSTLVLGGTGNLGNGVSGTTADLLYAATGSTFNIIGPNGSSGTGVLNVVLGQSGNFNAAGDIGVSAAISDAGGGFGMTKIGAGLLTLSGANTYSGGTTLSAGTISLSGSGTLGATTGSLTVNNGTLSLGGTNQTVGALNGSGGTINTSTGTSMLTIGTSGATGAYAGTIANGVGTVAVTKTGNGTQTLSGTNSYSGVTSINGGTLSVTANVNLGTTVSAAAINLGGGTLLIGGNGTNFSTSRAIILNAGGGILDSGASDNVMTFMTGSTVTNGGNLLTLQGSGNGSIADVIGNGSGGVAKNGAGTWTLSGANSYTGGTTVSNGTLQLSGSGTLGPTSGSLTVNGGTLNLGGTNQTVGALNGSGGAINSSTGISTLTLGMGGATGAYSGTIANGGGSVALTKTGSGIQTLSGTNSYTGATAINGGTLLINGNQSSATGAVTATNSGSMLGGTGTIGGDVTVNSAARIQGGNGTAGTTLTLSGALTLSDASIIQLALGPSGLHSTLARTGAGGWTFDSDQAFTFINLGAQAGTYDNIIIGLNADPGTTASWTITNPGFTGTFSYGGGNIDFNLTAVPEPSTWIAGALAMGVVGWSQRRRLFKKLKVVG